MVWSAAVVETVATVLTGVTAGVVVWRRGWLRRDAFAGAPRREVQLEMFDLAVGLLLMLVGMLAVGPLRRVLGLDFGKAGLAEMAAGHAVQAAAVTLLGQGLTQLPVVLYLVLRLGWQRQGLWEGGLWPRTWGRPAAAGGLGFLLATPMVFLVTMLTGVAAEVFRHPTPLRMHEGLNLLVQATPGARALFLVSFCVVAPLLEEIIFRGLVQTVLLRTLGADHRWPVILGAAGVFVAVHVEHVDWVGLPGLLVLAVVLGWLYERWGSLLPCVLVHVLFNSSNCVLTLLQ
jgi:membrane protease YdiL (CAAX protease family)